MKKLTALLLALLMLTFAFAACGGDNENASPEGKTFIFERADVVSFKDNDSKAFFQSLTVFDGLD